MLSSELSREVLLSLAFEWRDLPVLMFLLGLEDESCFGFYIPYTAHVLLVDFASPFNDEVCSNIQSCLEQFFALVCSLAGPPRIPYFGISALHRYSECLLPLQNVRGNFQHIYNALWELKTLKADMQEGQSTTSFGQALKDAILQFNRQSHIRQMSGFSTQLEVTVLSCQHADAIARKIEAAAQSIELEVIRKIQLVTLYNTASGVPLDETESPASTGSSEELGMIDILQTTLLPNDTLSIGEYFKHWLYDCGTDREHLHLSLHDGPNGSTMTLKCDLREQILSPSLLPSAASSFNLLSEISCKSFSIGSKQQIASVAVIHLAAIKLIKANGLCESIVFGTPFVLHPTLCWKLDWEELDSNQQHFSALCQHLHEKDMVLLACHNTTSAEQDSSHGGRAPSPTGYFLILPSHGSSLLVKPVANRELLLPQSSSNRVEKVVSDALEAVGSHLEKLEVCDVLNPLLFSSNLHQTLMPQLMKGSLWQKHQKRKISSKDQNKPTKVMAVKGRSKGLFQSPTSLTSGHVTNSAIGARPKNSIVSFKHQQFPTEL
ncbi:meiosis 1 arrest protein-like [Anneissia japonica]|uniref:meiosis 1 arrest protein-like n=1 Tax=Anneissia japonica TaxID=1529436 RepID=UPI001425B547|nr:meiosis 1 arrest protein-like [Anneissia japonica]